MVKVNRQEKAFQNNISVADDRMAPSKITSALRYNAQNMRVGKKKIGSKKWTDGLLNTTRLMAYPELDHVIGTGDAPITPEFISRRNNLQNQSRTRSTDEGSHEYCPGARQKLTKRGYKAMVALRKCPRVWTSSVTVVTSIATTKEAAVEQIETDGRQLGSFIERRFDNAAYVLVPEVDLILAKNVAANLFPDARWMRDLAPNQIVYKVHSHCVIYVPNMGSGKVEQAFKFTKSGKRSRLYAGANRVRALPVDVEPGNHDDRPDVIGCIGYAEKRHYRPAITDRMLETFPEWLWLTDKIEANPNLMVIGGMRRGIKDYCRHCETYFPLEEKCQCEPIISVIDDRYDDAPSDGITSVGICSQELGNDNIDNGKISLNCSGASHWNKTCNSATKKELVHVHQFVGLAQRIRYWLYIAMAP